MLRCPVYVNPAYVVTPRPDPADPDDISLRTVRDGETFRVKGDHQKVAEKLRSALRHNGSVAK
jgi:hypothetical protein